MLLMLDFWSFWIENHENWAKIPQNHILFINMYMHKILI